MKHKASILVAVCALVWAPVQAGFIDDNLIDPEDGMLDASDWLASAKGFLPVPIIISEPAVDAGLGLAGVFFHKRPESETRESDEFERPSLSAIAAAYTGNDSWFAGGGHLGRQRRCS